MIEVHKDNFDQEVLQAEGLIVVDFWGPKCEKCLAIMPDVERLAEQYGSKAKFCKLDTSGNRRLAIAQKVMGLPVIAFYKGGEKIAELGPAECTAQIIEAKIQELI
ncbi:MAG: thioredoxin [Firmicutes bacterium]|nr:thioredoxin [Dethiobacter sp.]MBS3887973.1 thioredoxin [Bacillota bacterium]MBS4055234.1 thioredoxin [Thermaerobacter sp.]